MRQEGKIKDEETEKSIEFILLSIRKKMRWQKEAMDTKHSSFSQV